MSNLLSSDPPPRFGAMLEHGLAHVADEYLRAELRGVAGAVSRAAWGRFLSARGPEDNRQEHEWVVFANVMRIADAEGLTLSERRVAAAFAFVHDSHFIPRITEREIREARTPEQKERLEQRKEEQRHEHMRIGATNARVLLTGLCDPRDATRPLLSPDEIERCVVIVSTHDAWKLRDPNPPPTADRLALACVEGDALWPLHPLGVLADLERPNGAGETRDPNDPTAWRAQLDQSRQTLVEFRAKWRGVPPDGFLDGESIFRTRAGWRIYRAWLRHWNLAPAAGP